MQDHDHTGANLAMFLPARRRTFATLGIAAVAALPLVRPASADVVVPDGFTSSIVVSGLNQPTSFSFLPDGRLLFTEQRTGRIRMVVNGHIAATDPALTLTDVNTTGMEQGLLGIAVDPQWPTRPFVYLYYNRTDGKICLVRYTASGDIADPTGEHVTLATPLFLIDDLNDITIYHQAGCLRFGPDGDLYVALGDDAMDCLAFDLTSLHGQILRLRVDTQPTGGGPQVTRASLDPGDNPFESIPNANANLVFAYGLRNPFRFQIDPLTGVIYCGDVGEDTFEEQDEIHSGDFMGWPYREADSIIVHVDCPEPGSAGSTPYVSPIAYFRHDQGPAAIISAGTYRPVAGGASNWPPAYYPSRGDVFYTDYYVGDLRRITWNGASWVRAAPVPGQPDDSTWAAGLATAADFLVGPDGSLWWMRQFDDSFSPSSGAIGRIAFNGATAVDRGGDFGRGLTAAPNPFARSVDLSFRLAAAERVKLVIRDLAGRRIVTLFDGIAPAGENRVSWKADEGGAGLPAGVYFARLERAAPAAPLTLRLLRTR
jgi:glucose/arabinose dehydrogenase